MKIPVNSIQVPKEFVDLAGEYYAGQADMLYAVASTGNLTTGTNRPIDNGQFDNDREPMTDQQWYLHLFYKLVWSIKDCIQAIAENPDIKPDMRLQDFARWTEARIQELHADYGIDE